METWILAKCRKVCLHKLAAWVVAGLAVFAVGAFNKQYLVNFFEGPYPLSASDLGNMRDPQATEHNFVRVVGSKIVDSGLHQIEVSKQSGTETRTVTAGYYVLKTEGRLLLVKASSPPSLVIEGSLDSIPSEVWNKLFDDPKQREELSPYFFPVLLNTESYRLPGFIGLSIAVIALSCVVFFGRKVWKELQHPSELLVIKRVERWGDHYRIANEIERENQEGVRLKHGSLRLTDKFVLFSGFFRFDVYRIEDLLWAYKRVTRHYHNFIPTGKTHNAVLIFYGGALDIKAREGKVDAIIKYFVEKTPWAVFGYTGELNEIFRKNTVGFCQAVEERRRQLNP